jgi:hypothetical protein
MAVALIRELNAVLVGELLHGLDFDDDLVEAHSLLPSLRRVSARREARSPDADTIIGFVSEKRGTGTSRTKCPCTILRGRASR